MIMRLRLVYTPLVILAVLSSVLLMACDLTATPTPAPSPTATATPITQDIEQRLKEMVEEAKLIRESIIRSAHGYAVAAEAEEVMHAVDAAIADLSLGTLTASSTCNDFSSTGGCGLTGGTVPTNFLYPNYLKLRSAEYDRTYSWDATGLVTTP